jgi:hypothetical protein
VSKVLLNDFRQLRLQAIEPEAQRINHVLPEFQIDALAREQQLVAARRRLDAERDRRDHGSNAPERLGRDLRLDAPVVVEHSQEY